MLPEDPRHRLIPLTLPPRPRNSTAPAAPENSFAHQPHGAFLPPIESSESPTVTRQPVNRPRERVSAEPPEQAFPAHSRSLHTAIPAPREALPPAPHTPWQWTGSRWFRVLATLAAVGVVILLVLLNFRRSQQPPRSLIEVRGTVSDASRSIGSASSVQAPTVELAQPVRTAITSPPPRAADPPPDPTAAEAGMAIETREQTLIAEILQSSPVADGPTASEDRPSFPTAGLGNSNAAQTPLDQTGVAQDANPTAMVADDSEGRPDIPRPTEAVEALPDEIYTLQRVAIHHEYGILGVPPGERLVVVGRGPGVWIVSHEGVQGEVDDALVSQTPPTPSR